MLDGSLCTGQVYAMRIHLLDEGGRYLVGKVLIFDNPLKELDATPLDHCR